MEVVKIRLQAQVHSMTDPLDIPKYRNAAHALFLILREEGPRTLYRGVALTALRQSTNQGSSHHIPTSFVMFPGNGFTYSHCCCSCLAANFTAYTELKALLQRYQPQYPEGGLPTWQTGLIGLISGAVGPFTNAPVSLLFLIIIFCQSGSQF
jgi:solute carrier family 25 citrate transporter 1